MQQSAIASASLAEAAVKASDWVRTGPGSVTASTLTVMRLACEHGLCMVPCVSGRTEGVAPAFVVVLPRVSTSIGTRDKSSHLLTAARRYFRRLVRCLETKDDSGGAVAGMAMATKIVEAIKSLGESDLLDALYVIQSGHLSCALATYSNGLSLYTVVVMLSLRRAGIVMSDIRGWNVLRGGAVGTAARAMCAGYLDKIGFSLQQVHPSVVEDITWELREPAGVMCDHFEPEGIRNRLAYRWATDATSNLEEARAVARVLRDLGMLLRFCMMPANREDHYTRAFVATLLGAGGMPAPYEDPASALNVCPDPSPAPPAQGSEPVPAPRTLRRTGTPTRRWTPRCASPSPSRGARGRPRRRSAGTPRPCCSSWPC